MEVVFASNFVARYRSHIAHINIKCRNFYQDHKLLKKIYQYFEDQVDPLGEKIRTLGAPAHEKQLVQIPNDPLISIDANRLLPVHPQSLSKLESRILLPTLKFFLFHPETKLDQYEALTPQRAVAAAPRAANLRANLSLALQFTHRPQEAAAEAREAVRLDPRNATGYDRLCMALRDLGDASGAEAAGREAVGLAPGLPFAWVNFANALIDSGKMAEAEKAFGEASRLAPFAPEVWAEMGPFYLKQSRYDEALQVLRRALELRRSTEWWPV